MARPASLFATAITSAAATLFAAPAAANPPPTASFPAQPTRAPAPSPHHSAQPPQPVVTPTAHPGYAAAPRAGYAPNQYAPPPPAHHYPAPPNYYAPQPNGYAPPNNGYAPPPQNFQPPANGAYAPAPPAGPPSYQWPAPRTLDNRYQPGPPARRELGSDPMRDAPTTTEEEKEKDATRKWIFSLEAVTNAPIDIGGRVTIEFPFRLRLGMGFGAVPNAYVGLVNNALASVGAYDAFVESSIDAAFSRGTVWRSQIGLRPFKRSGFYIDGGYAVVSLHGNVSGHDVAAIAANHDIETAGLGAEQYQLDTEIRMWVAEMGWQGQINNGFLFGIGIGVMGTLSSSTSYRVASGQSPINESAVETARAFFDEQIETYGYVPTLTVRLGYDLL